MPRSSVCSGREHYVANLDEEQARDIALYLNFDMIGSPNYFRGIYDGDGDGFGIPGPPGSDAIEAQFEDFYADRGLASEPTAFDGRSDYGPFIAVGIPSGGLFTGAEDVKTEEQARSTAVPLVRPSTRATTRRATRSTTWPWTCST